MGKAWDPQKWDGDIQADPSVAGDIDPLSSAVFLRGEATILSLRRQWLCLRRLEWPSLEQLPCRVVPNPPQELSLHPSLLLDL